MSIIIPCLNEKDTVAAVIRDAQINARRYFSGKHEIIVADNGSTDGTLDILKKMRWKNIVHVPVRGYGAALHWGILNARGKYVLYADADLSYPFANLAHFQAVLSQNPDLVLGSRLTGRIAPGAMPWLHRYVGTPILTGLIRLIYKIPTTDCNSGMRMVKKSFYQALNMRNSGMEWASELLLKTALHNGKYLEVPILFNKDKRHQAPHLARWSDGWRHLKAIILLKPILLQISAIGLTVISVLIFPVSFGWFFLLFLLAIMNWLSVMTLKLLEYGIEKTENRVALLLIDFKLVPTMGFLFGLISLWIWLIPNDHLGSKLLLAAIFVLLTMWAFLVETIKTHLINRLPDVK